MEARWDQVFSRKLGPGAHGAETNADIRNARSYLFELRNMRNLISHESPISTLTDEDVLRVSDTVTRLLKATKRARKEAAITEDISQEFGLRIYARTVEVRNPSVLREGEILNEGEKQVVHDEPVETQAARVNTDSVNVIDLSDADLRGMDLRGRNIRYAILTGADMGESNLRQENLSDAEVEGAELRRADLPWPYWKGVN